MKMNSFNGSVNASGVVNVELNYGGMIGDEQSPSLVSFHCVSLLDIYATRLFIIRNLAPQITAIAQQYGISIGVISDLSSLSTAINTVASAIATQSAEMAVKMLFAICSIFSENFMFFTNQYIFDDEGLNIYSCLFSGNPVNFDVPLIISGGQITSVATAFPNINSIQINVQLAELSNFLPN